MRPSFRLSLYAFMARALHEVVWTRLFTSPLSGGCRHRVEHPYISRPCSSDVQLHRSGVHLTLRSRAKWFSSHSRRPRAACPLLAVVALESLRVPQSSRAQRDCCCSAVYWPPNRPTGPPPVPPAGLLCGMLRAQRSPRLALGHSTRG